MTQEEISYLSNFERNFYTAMQANFTRAITESDITKMQEIYEKETGAKLQFCKHCASGIVPFLQKLGKLYYKAKEEIIEITNTNSDGEEKRGTVEQEKNESSTSSKVGKKRLQQKQSNGKDCRNLQS